MTMLPTLWILVLLAPQDAPQLQARELVDRLRSDKIEDRLEAARKLKELGPLALDALEGATRSDDPEVQARAKQLISIIRVRQRLSPNLLRTLPGVDERLALGNSQERTNIFLDAASQVNGRARYPTLRREDLDSLLSVALVFEGAKDPDDWRNTCLALSHWHLTNASEGVVRYLQDPDARVRWATVEALGDLGDPGPAAKLVGFLKDSDESVQTNAFWALAKLHPTYALASLRKLTKDADSEVRRKAVSLLGIFGDKESESDIVRLLSDEALLVRGNAAVALSNLGAKSHIPEIATLLGDKEGPVRGLAIDALKGLRATELIPRIDECLKDEVDTVRFCAVECLAEWSAQDKIDHIASLVGDPVAFVRAAALRALARLHSTKHTELIVGALKDSEESVKWAAIDALGAGEAGDVTPHLRVLLKDQDPLTCQHAAELLVRLGITDGVSLLLEGDRRLECLNALRQPALWRIVSRPLDKELSGTTLEILEQISRELGLRLDLTAMTPADRDTWLSDKRGLAAVGGIRIERALNSLAWTGWILDESELRLLPQEETRTFWRDWWAGRQKK